MQVKFHLPVCCLAPQHVSGQLESLRFHSSHQLKQVTLAGKLGRLHIHLSLCYAKVQETMDPQNQAVILQRPRQQAVMGKE